MRQQHVIISGFSQHISRENGVVELWRKMRPLADCNTAVDLWTWDSNWPDVAAMMKMIAGDDAGQVFIYAYSWGAGWGFVQLARELDKLGMTVERAVLADPVYRSPLLPTWLPANLLSLSRFPKIEVPANVGRVAWTYQRQDYPRGHQPVAAKGSETIIDPGILLHHPHAGMDNSQTWHALSLQVASEAHEPHEHPAA